MATLKNEHKEFIVRKIACYSSPSEVIIELEEIYGVTGLEPKQIAYYNPDVSTGGKLGKQWKDLHSHYRKEFLDGIIDIPIANKRYRLLELQKSHDKLRLVNNEAGANAILKQAQDEMAVIKDIEPKIPENGDSYYTRMNILLQEACRID